MKGILLNIRYFCGCLKSVTVNPLLSFHTGPHQLPSSPPPSFRLADILINHIGATKCWETNIKIITKIKNVFKQSRTCIEPIRFLSASKNFGKNAWMAFSDFLFCMKSIGITEVKKVKEDLIQLKYFCFENCSLKDKLEVCSTYKNYVSNSGRTQKILFYTFFTFLKTKYLWK